MPASTAPIRTAELLSIGTELTFGETRDTNAGDLARELVRHGVTVGRITALPDDLAAVREAFEAAVARSDLVVATGGLGPTPDDLTRESIAAMLGESPSVDPELEAWLRRLFERRGIAFPEQNLKQAWLIPSATAIPNANGTAPGWWVDAPQAIVVALPGPPREMRPMWSGWVLPRLEARGLGVPMAVTTLRLTGIGESAVAARLGAMLGPDERPSMATYARNDAVDIRIWATAERDGEDPEALVDEAASHVLAELGDHVWGRDGATWASSLAAALEARRERLSLVEVGLRGAAITLLGEGLGDRLAFAETLPKRPPLHDGRRPTLEALAARVRAVGESEIGLAVEARERGGDTAVTVAIDGSPGRHRETRVVFMGGELGRGRAGVAAAAILLQRLTRV